MGIQQYLGQNARDPHVAGLVIGAGAVAFHAAWILSLPPIAALRIVPVDPTSVPFFVVASANAYLTTRVVWHLLIPESGALTYGRAGVVGVALGLIALFTLSAVGIPLVTVVEDGLGGLTSGAPNVLALVLWLLTLGLIGIVEGFRVTYGIPVLITVGGSLWLTHLERRFSVS